MVLIEVYEAGREGKVICRIDDYSSKDVSFLSHDGKGPI